MGLSWRLQLLEFRHLFGASCSRTTFHFFSSLSGHLLPLIWEPTIQFRTDEVPFAICGIYLSGLETAQSSPSRARLSSPTGVHETSQVPGFFGSNYHFPSLENAVVLGELSPICCPGQTAMLLI